MPFRLCPNGFTAALIDVEKIFPPGTQGDTSGLPVDIIGDMILVMNTNWQVVWYWDSFDPGSGGNGYTPLPVSRMAPLGRNLRPSTRTAVRRRFCWAPASLPWPMTGCT